MLILPVIRQNLIEFQGRRAGADGVDVALNPEELDLDTVAMAAKYEARVKEQEMVQKEDFSDMVAEHAAKQKASRVRKRCDILTVIMVVRVLSCNFDKVVIKETR